MDKKTKVLEKIFDILGEIMAVLTVVLYAVLIINANWSFIPEGVFLNVLLIMKNYAALAVVLIVGLEAVVKRNFIIKLLFILLVAVIVIFQFFPGTWANITNLF